jgi:RNA polymerase sigma factor (sigma-70 family)
MTRANASAALCHLRRLLAASRSDGLRDSELLHRFLSERSEEAFAALVRRHGGLVLGVCRRVLHHPQDAEDVFQATFLVLARKAAAVRHPDAVGAWLYRVAYRLALRARAGIDRRRRAESAARATADYPCGGRGGPAEDPLTGVSWREVQDLLDEELARLPEQIRGPLLLCYLEGLTQEEAATRLGWCKRTLKDRLLRGRDLLRRRLARRGLPLGAVLSALLLPHGPAAAVPPALSAAAARTAAPTATVPAAVAALAGGALRELVAGRLKAAAAAILLTAAAFAAGVGLLAGPQAPPPAAAAQARQPSAPQAAPGADARGDPLPPGAVLRLGTQRLRHGGGISALAWSPDGKWVASGGGFSDWTVRLWDAATGREIRQLGGHNGPVRALAVSPDAKRIISISRNGPFILWDTASGKPLAQMNTKDELWATAFAPDGKHFLTGGSTGVLTWWDGVTGAGQGRFANAHDGPVRGIALTRDGQTIASVGEDWTLRLSNAATGKALHILPDQAPLEAVAFSPDGKTVAAGGQSRTIRLWDTATGKAVGTLEGHTAVVRALSWAPDGKTLASASDDATVRLWDPVRRKEVLRFKGHRSPVWSVAFSPDGKAVASGANDRENAVRVWDAATGRERFDPAEHSGWVGYLSLLPGGKTLVTACSDGSVRLWDLPTGKPLDRFVSQQSRAKAFALAPGGKLAAGACPDGMLRLVELPTGRPVRQWQAHPGVAKSVAFSPDGRLLFSSGDERATYVWETATGKQVGRLGPDHPEVVWSYAFTADGKTLITGGHTGALRLWDFARRVELGQLVGHENAIEQIVLSPDGRLLATAADDFSARVWDLETRKEVRRFDKLRGYAYGTAFSNDGRSLATGTWERDVRIWDLATGQERAHLQGHRGAVASFVFLPGDRRLLSGSSDSTVLLWDLSALGRGAGGAKLTPEAAAAEWGHLHGPDGARAYRALWTLAAAPDQALPLLRRELRPVAAMDDAKIRKWIADLDNKRFALRDKARAELKRLGDLAWPALRKALQGKPSLELRMQALQLLGDGAGPFPTGERLRQQRSLELLEQLNTPEARRLLADLAAGAPEASLTLEAQAALRRATP